MKIVRIGSEYRLGLTKQFCQEMNIDIGDSYEVTINQGGIITLYPMIKKDERNKQPINNSKQTKEKIEVFKSNLEEGKNFSKKYYTECGLIIRTKRKYLEQYCDRCKGQLLDNYDGCYKCKYRNFEVDDKESTDTPKVIKVNTEIIKKDTIKKSNLSAVIRNEDKEVAKQNNKFVVESINKHIEALLKTLKSDADLNNTIEKELNKRAQTLIQPISYNHLHTCNNCQNDYNNGFNVDGIFLCKTCAKEDFIKYLKEVKKEV